MVKFFHVEKDASGRTLHRTDNERLSVEFVVSVAIDESADPDDRITATQWLGVRTERHGFFHAVQLAHVQSHCKRVRDNACLNLLTSVGSENLLLYLPEDGNYRARLFNVMLASKERIVQWTQLIVRHELGEKNLYHDVVSAFAAYEQRYDLYVTPTFSANPSIEMTAGRMLRRAFQQTLGVASPRGKRPGMVEND